MASWSLSEGSIFQIQNDGRLTTIVSDPELVSSVGIEADGRLIIVSKSESRIVALTSANEWATARLAGVGTFEMPATTAAVVDGEIYVVHPHFADEDPPSVERVTLQ